MSLKKVASSIRTRLVIRIVLFLALSLIIVSTVIYFLLATSLRRSDQNLILNLRQTYLKLYEESGPALLKDRISPEILLVIKDQNGTVIFEHWPKNIDYDFEDEDEIKQIKNATRSLPQRVGWHHILLLSGDEDKDYLEKFEYHLRLLANKRNWETILPIIDNDLFEVHVTKMNDHEWILIGKSSEEREENLSKIRYISLLVIAPFLLMGLILSFFLAENILRPIKRLAKTISDISKGASEARAEVSGSGDEIDRLAEEFNFLHDKNEVLVKNLKETVDNVAHDLRTPLTRFRSSAEYALMRENDHEALKVALEEALESSDELIRLLNAIMDVAEAEANTLHLNLEEISVASIVSSVIDLYSQIADEKNILLNFMSKEPITIKADYQRMMQALGNILDNAIKYSPNGSKIQIKTEIKDKKAVISIMDEGQGIKSEDLPKIWKRLYRGDASRSTKGLGIGLSLVKAVIEAHKGQIDVVSHEGEGSTFIITLPTCNVSVI